MPVKEGPEGNGDSAPVNQQPPKGQTSIVHQILYGRGPGRKPDPVEEQRARMARASAIAHGNAGIYQLSETAHL